MNEAPEDRLFERWCRHGDPQALGALFDATALRLLKLAIHIVGDANEAEDLVQATFLAAIEQRATVDASRPVMPWLSGVLAHKAQQHRRRAGRVVDADRLAQRAAEDPSLPLERRELDGEVARAIDQVGEPSRAVLVLRLRHGMEIADIAHVLDRDPGTVRVQLHRGLEKLRGKLPAALVSSLFAGWVAPRGLDALRAVVVHKAALATAGAGSSLALGGLIVSKKVLVAAAALLALAAVVWIQQSTGDALSSQSVAAVPLEMAELERPDKTSAPVVGTGEATTARTAAGERETAPASSIALSGRVVDGQTKQPISGVDLRLFEPRERLALDLVREQPDLYGLDANGRVKPHTMMDWPLIVEPSAVARFGRGPLLVYGRPSGGEEPTASTRSGGDGSFSLPCGARGGVLEGAIDGYVTRWLAVRTADIPATLELWRGYEIHGVVLGPDGTPVQEPLDLVLMGWLPRPDLPEVPTKAGEATKRSLVAFDSLRGNVGLGSWTTRTDATGQFRVQVGAPTVSANLLTPGWGLAPGKNQTRMGNELTIHCARAPMLHFTDAASGMPIERVRLLGRELGNRYVRWSGEFSAPNGWFQLPGDWTYFGTSTLAFVAWNASHAPTEVSVPDITSVATIEVPMAAGAPETLDGVVLRDGAPAAGVEVSLLGRSPMQWRVDEDHLVDATRTSADGSFQLTAASGAYLVRVRTDDAPFLENVRYPDQSMWLTRAIAGREPYFQPIDLPTGARIMIDLDRTGRIEVTIVDTLGVPRVEHMVAMRAADGRQATVHTDAQGLARFPLLPPGRYKLHTPHRTPRTGFSFSGGELRDVEVTSGNVERVRIEVPADTAPRHARIEARGVRLYSGWRTRFVGESWEEIAADGTVPMDLNTDRLEFEVIAPDGRRWFPRISKNTPDGHVFLLDPGSCRYKGRLEHEDGKPWAGVAIHATMLGDPRVAPPRVAAVTGASGEFELAGLGSDEYQLDFQTQIDRSLFDNWSNKLAGVSFIPTALPSDAGTWISIRAAESLPTVRVHGVVELASGQPLANAMVCFDCDVPGQDGTLRLGGNHSFNRADERGGFDVKLPLTARLTVRVYDTTDKGPVLTQELGSGREDEALRLVVP